MATWFPAGLPRTGTMSTYTALEMILPGKCHHMARCYTSFPLHFAEICFQGWNRRNLSKHFLLAKSSCRGRFRGWVETVYKGRTSECWGGLSNFPFLEGFGQDLSKCKGWYYQELNSVIRLVCSGRWVSSFRNCPLVVSLIIALNRSVLKSTIQVLLNDRDPVRWYESVKNTILQVVGLVNGPATR